MIVFNKKWNEEVLSKALLDIVQPSVNPNVACGECTNVGGIMVENICSASDQSFNIVNFGSGNASGGIGQENIAEYQKYKLSKLENFSLVTEKFIKVLDKFYKKLYHEDFTQNVFYSQHILSIFQGIASPIYINTTSNHGGFTLYNKNHGNPQIIKTNPFYGFKYPPLLAGINPNDFKLIIDRMISLGLMDEEDRLDSKDQCFLTGLKRTDIQIIDNKEEKTIDIICNKISDIVPDIKTENLASLEGVDQTGVGMSVEHAFHKDKRLFLMYTPYLKNEATVKYGNTPTDFIPEEPTTLQIKKPWTYSGWGNNDDLCMYHAGTSHEPVSYFKPKKYQTRFNKGSMPMATHLIWRIGTQDTRENAINASSPFIPEVIFDHVDRISHIDNFKLRIKYQTVRF